MILNPDDLWYGHSAKGKLLLPILCPLSLVFALLSASRRFGYRHGILKSQAIRATLIIVGGITVGGSGKTPLCIALLQELKKQGYHPGLISRGYKGNSNNYPLLVTQDTMVEECGDEPLLIKRSVGDQALVAVDPDRVRGAQALSELGCDVILSDDGMQHYALKRDAEIAVLDGQRLLGNGRLLPAGPLREGKWRLQKCDLIVCNGGETEFPHSFKMTLETVFPKPLRVGDKELAPRSSVWVLAGIGNPKRVRQSVEALGFEVVGMLLPGDHQKMKLKELIDKLQSHPVVMTAKDAVKYQACALDGLYVLDVNAVLPQSFKNAFNDVVKRALQKAKKHQLR